MNRTEFGTLIASLRTDMKWTQRELAERSGLDVTVVSNIERGERKALLKDNILLKLAEGFHLTSMERMEFMFAASGVTEVEKMRKDHAHPRKQFSPQSFLKETSEHIACITVPVFITDAFCDILMANTCAIEFYQTAPEFMLSAGSCISGFNQMRIVFDRNSNFREVAGDDDMEREATLNIRYFRRRTLRVRSKSYFQDLLKDLLDPEKYPDFGRYWDKILHEEQDDFSLYLENPKSEQSNSFLSAETLFALTPYGELYMHQLLPLNAKTADRMESISKKTGEGCQLFAPFPDKRKS